MRTSMTLSLALFLALSAGRSAAAGHVDVNTLRPKLPASHAVCEEEHRKKAPHCFGIHKDKERHDCLIVAGRGFRDCQRKAQGVAPINWKAHDACGPKHHAAVKAAKCAPGQSHIECLRPIFRAQESCLRVAAGLPPHDLKKLDACRATLKGCETSCGSHEPSPALSDCRRTCFGAWRTCRDGTPRASD